MTELSPAAQQVFWAFNEAASGKPDDWHYLPAIAAALRAAVEHLGYELELDDLSGTILHVINANSLFAIADELDNFSK